MLNKKQKKEIKIYPSFVCPRKPNNFLSTIQVGITFIGLLQGASLSASLGGVIASWFGNYVWAKTAGSVISLVFLTYISIVLGELYPKRIAMNLRKLSGYFSSSHYPYWEIG